MWVMVAGGMTCSRRWVLNEVMFCLEHAASCEDCASENNVLIVAIVGIMVAEIIVRVPSNANNR